jgi:hypothetical protein
VFDFSVPKEKPLLSVSSEAGETLKRISPSCPNHHHFEILILDITCVCDECCVIFVCGEACKSKKSPTQRFDALTVVWLCVLLFLTPYGELSECVEEETHRRGNQ